MKKAIFMIYSLDARLPSIKFKEGSIMKMKISLDAFNSHRHDD